MATKKIKSLNINTSNLSKTGESRRFSVSGERGAKFNLRIQHSRTDSGEYFYNFLNNDFQSEFNSENVLNVEMNSSIYNGSIPFPYSAGTYNLLLLPAENTVIENSNQVINKSFTQGENVTVTIATATENTDTYGQSSSLSTTSDPAAANVTSVAQAGSIGSSILQSNTSVFNKKNDANGFGLIVTNFGKITDYSFYYLATETVDRSSFTEKTDTVDGSVSSSTAVTLDTSYATTGIQVGDYIFGTGVTYGTTVAAVNVGSDVKDITLSAAMSISDGVTLTFITPSNEVIVDDLTDLAVGMQLYYLTSTAKPSAKTIIQSINSQTKTLTLSTNQAVSDGLTMTFRAYGFALINSITGASFVSSSVATWKATAANSVDTQLRAAVTNKNITVTTTYGISGGSLIEFSGANVINTSTNNVNAVTPDPDGSDADGLLTCDVTQAFVGKEKIKFKPTSRSSSLCTQCDIYFAIKIAKYPSANKTIYLDLDKFITPGTAS